MIPIGASLLDAPQTLPLIVDGQMVTMTREAPTRYGVAGPDWQSDYDVTDRRLRVINHSARHLEIGSSGWSCSPHFLVTVAPQYGVLIFDRPIGQPEVRPFKLGFDPQAVDPPASWRDRPPLF